VSRTTTIVFSIRAGRPGSLEAGLGVLACVLVVGAVLASRLPFAAVRAPAAEPSPAAIQAG
jgi:hypothetical protein